MTDKAAVPLTSTLIFGAESHDYQWASRMLVAIESAKALGVPRFEIDVTTTQHEVPIIEDTGRTDVFGSSVRVKAGTRLEPTHCVKVYAIRVEASDDR